MHTRNIFTLLCSQARHNGQNYVYALLTGYRDPPAGVQVNLLQTFFLINPCYQSNFVHSADVIMKLLDHLMSGLEPKQNVFEFYCGALKSVHAQWIGTVSEIKRKIIFLLNDGWVGT